MDLKNLQYVKNLSEDNVATILLYDTIGEYYDAESNKSEGISGKDFAKEIEDLQKVASKINVRINSTGGNVIDGYSIVSAIQNSKVPVDTYIDGMAASIAGVIAVCGQNIFMKDYGTLMVHNPYGGVDEKALEQYKDTLVTILSNNSKLTQDQISDLMDVETYISAKKAKEMGLVSQVIKSDKKVKVDTSSITNMMYTYNQLINPTKKQILMKQVKNKLGLDENVSEDVIVDSIQTLQEKNKTLSETLAAELLAKEELQNKLNAIETEKLEAEKTKIAEMVNSFIDSGKINETEKDAMVKLATVDFDSVKNMLNKIDAVKIPTTKTPIKIMDAVKPSNPASVEKANWTIRDYEKKDSEALKRIKNETPAIYEQMYNDFYKK